MYAPVTTGNLSFVLDNQNINLTIQPYSKVFEGFDWIKVGSFDLTTGTHTLEILNANGYNAISDFGIVPQVYMEQATQNLSQVLENKQLLYIFNTSNHYVKMFTTEINSSSLTKMESVLTTAVYLPKTADYVISYYSSTSSIDNSVLSIDNEALSTKSSLENWTESSSNTSSKRLP